MLYGLTETEREEFDERGFLVVENALAPQQVASLNAVVDELYAKYGGDEGTGRLEMRNAVAQHPLLMELISHRYMLPLVVDLLGPNIKMRSTHLDVRPPLRREKVTNELGADRWGEPEQWHVDGPIYGYPQVNDLLPMMEVKIGFYLSDVKGPEYGPLCVIPGSHKLDYRMLAEGRPPAEYIHRVTVPAGSAVLFRTGLWHCVSPNFSDVTRKVLYYAYSYRWIQPSDYLTQAPELLAGCTSIQKQLLGGSISARGELGYEAEKRPQSLYWYFDPIDVPILEWFDKLPKHREQTGMAKSVTA